MGGHSVKNKIALIALAAVAMPTLAPAPAFAEGDHARVYHGRHGYYRYRCKKSNGTTGLVLGAVGGGLIGHALGGGTVGTIAGAGGGALLGRHLDKKNDAAQNRRNHC
jgi:hypothetical protein